MPEHLILPKDRFPRIASQGSLPKDRAVAIRSELSAGLPLDYRGTAKKIDRPQRSRATVLEAYPVRVEPDTLYFFKSDACPYRKTGIHPRFREGMLFGIML
jgi:hypothetical protein